MLCPLVASRNVTELGKDPREPPTSHDPHDTHDTGEEDSVCCTLVKYVPGWYQPFRSEPWLSPSRNDPGVKNNVPTPNANITTVISAIGMNKNKGGNGYNHTQVPNEAG